MCVRIASTCCGSCSVPSANSRPQSRAATLSELTVVGPRLPPDEAQGRGRAHDPDLERRGGWAEHVHLALYHPTSRFHDANPKVYAAFLKAHQEAIAFINADKRAAAQVFLDMESQGMTLDEVLEVLNDPDIRYTTSPENLMKYADFMADVGSIKRRPAA
jgi:hypothetical protein